MKSTRLFPETSQMLMGSLMLLMLISRVETDTPMVGTVEGVGRLVTKVLINAVLPQPWSPMITSLLINKAEELEGGTEATWMLGDPDGGSKEEEIGMADAKIEWSEFGERNGLEREEFPKESGVNGNPDEPTDSAGRK